MTHPINLVWPTDSRYVTQHFGQNAEFYQAFGLPAHEGIDLRAPMGANLYALADGEVTFVGFPENHPYGLFIRLTHQQNGMVFRSIYAHLEKALVQVGQTIKAGDLIGLADNSGNSLGSHLHLTFKIDGEQTGSYPAGIVDPWPYLKDAPAAQQIPSDTPPASNVIIYTTELLNLRTQPTTSSEIVALLGVGEPLTVLGDAEAAKNTLGVEGQWVQVQTSSNFVGYAAAWFVEIRDEARKPSGLIVYPITKVNVRAGRSLDAAVKGSIDIGDGVMIMGAAETVGPLIGQAGEWLPIEADSGLRGYVAAEAVRRAGELPPLSGLEVYPTDVLSLRAKPTTDSNRLTLVTPGDALDVLGDLEAARLKVGQADAWLEVKIPSGQTGYVAAEYVQSAEQASFGDQPPIKLLTVQATHGAGLYAIPMDEDGTAIATVPSGTRLDLLDTDLTAARRKIGQADVWLFVATTDDQRGWVRANRLALAVTE